MDKVESFLQSESTVRPAGWHLTQGRILSQIKGRYRPHVAKVLPKCMDCGSEEATFYAFAANPDFDTSVLPKKLRRKFVERAIGRCNACGLTQEYNRFSKDELLSYLSILSDKDLAVSEEAYHTFPVPPEFKKQHNHAYYGKRLKQWDAHLLKKVQPKRALFLRPTFGASTQHLHTAYGTECFALEISSISQRTIQKEQPHVRFLNGNIHGYFYGDFLMEEPFDAIFCFHSIVHSIDVNHALECLRDLLTPDGIVVFTHEITVKPYNPFHMLFPSESWWHKKLSSFFSAVDVIPDCEENPDPFVRNFTLNGDCPDLVAYK